MTPIALWGQGGVDSRYKGKLGSPEPQDAPPIGSQLANLKGYVVDAKTGEELIGAQVLVEGTVFGTFTDFDGKYELLGLQPSTFSIVVTYLGYQSKAINGIELFAGQTTELPITLDPDGVMLNEVVIQSTPRQESMIAAILAMRNNPAISDILSGDMILKTSSDLYLSTALSRMPGVSLVEDRFLVIRGLYERYNLFTLNGAVLPVANIERQAFEFNTIPSNIVSQLQLIKSGSPDKIGSFSGGLIEIQTPSFPDKNQLLINYQVLVNSKTAFQNINQYGGSGTGTVGFFGRPANVLGAGFPSIAQLAATAPDSPERTEAAKLLDNNVLPVSQMALPGQNISVSYQGRYPIGKREIGFTVAGNLIDIYKHEDIQYRIVRSFDPIEGFNPVTDSSGLVTTTRQQGVNLFVNAAIKGATSTISWHNLVNITQWNAATTNIGRYIVDPETQTFGDYLFLPLRFQRQSMYSTQLTGDHLLGITKQGAARKLNWLAYYTYSKYNEPGFRAMNYLLNSNDNQYYYDTTLADAYKRYANIFTATQTDNVFGGSLNVILPIEQGPVHIDFKTGLFALSQFRHFESRAVGLFPSLDGFSLSEAQLNYQFSEQFFSASNIGPHGFVLEEATSNHDRYNGQATTLAAYGMFNLKVGKLEMNFGSRVENYIQRIASVAIVDDKDIVLVDNSMTDLLPSLNAKLALTPKTNLKGSIYQSLARPELRELSRLNFFNIVSGIEWVGNPGLQRTKITNLDLRWEFFPKGVDLISVSLFGKYFENPIEQYIDQGSIEVIQQYSLVNRKSAWVGGIEFEVRKKLDFFGVKYLENFGIYGNLSLLRSRVDADFAELFQEGGRQLQGQSKYLVNAGLFFTEPKLGLTIDLFYSRNGARISVVGTGPDSFPDLWELPRDVFDIQISKKVGTHWEFKLALQDIFNQPIRRVQIYDGRTNFDETKDKVLLRNQRGFTSVITVTFKL